MPIVTPSQAELDKQYKSKPHGVWVGYQRIPREGATLQYATRIIEGCGLSAADEILIVGAGYGWVAEKIEELLPGIRVVAIDNSAHFNATKGQSDEAEIRVRMVAQGFDPGGVDSWRLDKLTDKGVRARHHTLLNEDGLSNGSRARIRQARVKASFDWAVTENALPWLSDAECQTLSAEMHKDAVNVAHLVTPWMADKASNNEPLPLWNWKLIKPDAALPPRSDIAPADGDWKTLLPNDSIIHLVTGEIA